MQATRLACALKLPALLIQGLSSVQPRLYCRHPLPPCFEHSQTHSLPLTMKGLALLLLVLVAGAALSGARPGEGGWAAASGACAAAAAVPHA